MTTPGGSAPDGAYVLGGRYGQDITEESAHAIMRGNAPLSGFQDAQDALKGRFNGVTQQFVDGQLELNQRLDLLYGVNGYAAAYMGQNWNVLPGVAVELPFNRQIGPVKNAELVTATRRGYIRLLAEGLWRADLLANCSSGGDNYELYLSVRRPDGSLYSEKRIDGADGRGSRVSLLATHTFVVPGPNYTVHGQIAWGGLGLKNVRGGTRLSALVVNRWSADLGPGTGDQDVPDGGNL